MSSIFVGQLEQSNVVQAEQSIGSLVGQVGQLSGPLVGQAVQSTGSLVGQVEQSNGSLVGQAEQSVGPWVGQVEQSVGHLEHRLALASALAFLTFLSHSSTLIVSSSEITALLLIFVRTSLTTFTMLFTLMMRRVRTTLIVSSKEMTTLPGL